MERSEFRNSIMIITADHAHACDCVLISLLLTGWRCQYGSFLNALYVEAI